MVQRYKKNRTYANAQCDLCCKTYGRGAVKASR